MALVLSHTSLTAILLVLLCSVADCYDPLDPNGNITVTFDIHKWTSNGYMARVTIQNYYQYRHLGKPGWQLGWTWARGEVIWSMTGAFATQRGDCSSFKDQIPHSCNRNPVIADLVEDAGAENRTENCCKDGVLSAWAINPLNSFSSFEMLVGNLGHNSSLIWPSNLTLMAPGPGYTCGSFADYAPTISQAIGGRRQEQVYSTWKATCTYSSFVANKAPTCCVSLSAFYNPTITSCPECSCECRPSVTTTSSCMLASSLTSTTEFLNPSDMVQCTDHMCPIRVHWHLKNNYREHWRVKLTISNYNYGTNYSDWNLLVQHPGFSPSTITYSFNNTLLPTYGFADEAALFWGINFYNRELVQASEREVGSLTTEILLSKDVDSFTLRNGWAYPRRVYFNGENCEMPLPDDFPMLPSGSSTVNPSTYLVFLAGITLLVLIILDISHLLDWSFKEHEC